MKTLLMCFSVLQVPRCRFHTLASSWWQSFHGLKDKSRISLVGLNASDVEGAHSRRWTRRPITTKTEGLNEKTLSSKQGTSLRRIVEDTVSTSTTLDVNKFNVQTFQSYDVQTKITEKTDVETLSSLYTIVVYDIETTGFSREYERIIEIALQDIGGGHNSTFQTLVNPERSVPNTEIHGITTNMVNRPEVPRMVDLIPILLKYVRSRQKPGGYVLMVAHNSKNFDAPFLINEFARCSAEIPSDWLFMDTLSLAREWRKAGGSKNTQKLSLSALREHYDIPLIGSAHRAMSDVEALASVLQRLTFDMKMPLSGLIERSFKASDIINSTKETLRKKKTVLKKKNA